LAGILALSATTYVTQLGFYSDDWYFLSLFESVAAQGRSVVAAAAAEFEVRAVQGAYAGFLFQLFGRNALGYHLVNTAVTGIAVGLLYLLLLRIHVGRRRAFACALLFLVLPQLSTVRVWYSGFQVPLSLALALCSMHALLFLPRPASGGGSLLR
jgi:hypothetical protein